MRLRTTATRILIALMVATVAFASTAVLGASPAGALSGDEQAFLNRINALRQSVGVRPLAVDGNMTALAASHTAHMIATGGLSHAATLSTGVSGPWTSLAENVGRGGSVDAVWGTFVGSPAHYRNLVDPSVTHVGVAVLYDGGGQLWTTHRFVGRPGGAVGATPAPPPARRVAPVPRRAEPQVSAPEPPPPAPEPPPTPLPKPDPARVSAVLDVLRASPD